jgi:MSHA pilin protein MshC
MSIKNNSGFTIIEVVAVLIVMSIITAFAVGRVADNKPELVAQKEVLKVHLRYAQSRAMNSNDNYGIQSDATGHTYSLFKYNGASGVVIVNFPGEGANIDLSMLGLSMDADIIVSFDSRGIPYMDNSGTLQMGDRTLTLSSGSDSENITITQNTGFIQ